jgi:hypothetical protein
MDEIRGLTATGVWYIDRGRLHGWVHLYIW